MHALRPHMHTRGKRIKFKVVYPDNSTEDLHPFAVPTHEGI